MITIGNPCITTEQDTVYLRAPVQISEDTVQVYLEKTSSLKNTGWLTAYDYPPSSWQKSGGDPLLIELNTVPGDHAQRVCGRPLFGEMTDWVLEDYFHRRSITI